MSSSNPSGPEAVVGILVMDASIERIPGDAGNPATFPFPVHCRKVAGATLERLIRERDPSLLTPFVEAGLDLIRQGARALTTTCGFMILFQEKLSARLPVPVFTSSLLQLPFLQRMLGPHERIGVITADAANLTAEHLRQAGADAARLTVCGLEDQPNFREAIFGGNGRIDPPAVETEVVAVARRMVGADPAIRALLFECANLPPYASTVQKAVDLPVYDFVTMIHHVHSALERTPFGLLNPS